jgi:hypothetical protein
LGADIPKLWLNTLVQRDDGHASRRAPVSGHSPCPARRQGVDGPLARHRSQTIGLEATFAYDNEGRLTGETYPTDNSGNTANLSYTFGSMGRLNTMTDNIASETVITGASYGPANERTSISGGSYLGAWAGETLTYNSLKQLTSVYSYSYPNVLSITYTYPSTGNNGKISSQTDNISGEQVSYTYDALNRLATAGTQSGFSPAWSQTYSYL